MDIRRAEEKDIPHIEELLYQVHKVHSDKRPDLFIPGAKKYTTEEIKSILKNDDTPVYVAETDGCISGYAFCIYQKHCSKSSNYTSLYIDDLCVSDKSRGQKIGTQLYDFVLDMAKKNGCHNLTLNVWACNEAAMKFYEKCGLKIQKYGMEQILD